MATSGWETYLQILREAEQAIRTQVEVACPQCGEPLEETPRGRHCRFDGYVAGR